MAYLKERGWEVAATPVESGQVRLPKEADPVYDRYLALQKSQGFDLASYAGKTVMRYVYQVTNYPGGGTEPVYATLLIYKNQVIGGDVTDTSAKGQVRPLEKPTTPSTSQTTLPTAVSYTHSDAADERSSVGLGGRRHIQITKPKCHIVKLLLLASELTN